MNERTIKLIENLSISFDGNPWYGISLMKKLNTIDFSIVNEMPNCSNSSIVSLVQHIINWRIFVIEKIKGNSFFDIEMDSNEDWTKLTIQNLKDWSTLLEKLTATQRQLLEILNAKKNDHFLENIVPGKKYDFEYLIRGLIQHDTYHLGQISILYKQEIALKK